MRATCSAPASAPPEEAAGVPGHPTIHFQLQAALELPPPFQWAGWTPLPARAPARSQTLTTCRRVLFQVPFDSACLTSILLGVILDTLRWLHRRRTTHRSATCSRASPPRSARVPRPTSSLIVIACRHPVRPSPLRRPAACLWPSLPRAFLDLPARRPRRPTAFPSLPLCRYPAVLALLQKGAWRESLVLQHDRVVPGVPLLSSRCSKHTRRAPPPPHPMGPLRDRRPPSRQDRGHPLPQHRRPKNGEQYDLEASG